MSREHSGRPGDSRSSARQPDGPRLPRGSDGSSRSPGGPDAHSPRRGTLRRARHTRAVGLRGRDPQRAALRVPRRCAARGAAGAGGTDTTVQRYRQRCQRARRQRDRTRARGRATRSARRGRTARRAPHRRVPARGGGRVPCAVRGAGRRLPGDAAGRSWRRGGPSGPPLGCRRTTSRAAGGPSRRGADACNLAATLACGAPVDARGRDRRAVARPADDHRTGNRCGAGHGRRRDRTGHRHGAADTGVGRRRSARRLHSRHVAICNGAIAASSPAFTVTR